MRPTPSRSFTARSCARRSNAVAAPKSTGLSQDMAQPSVNAEAKQAPQVLKTSHKAAVAA